MKHPPFRLPNSFGSFQMNVVCHGCCSERKAIAFLYSIHLDTVLESLLGKSGHENAYGLWT